MRAVCYDPTPSPKLLLSPPPKLLIPSLPSSGLPSLLTPQMLQNCSPLLPKRSSNAFKKFQTSSMHRPLQRTSITCSIANQYGYQKDGTILPQTLPKRFPDAPQQACSPDSPISSSKYLYGHTFGAQCYKSKEIQIFIKVFVGLEEKHFFSFLLHARIPKSRKAFFLRKPSLHLEITFFSVR